MVFRAKNLFSLVICAVTVYGSWQAYNYFFDATKPNLKLSGLESNGFYSGDVHCFVGADKSGELSVWLDGNPLIAQFKLARNGDHPFTIPTRTVANGKHALKVQLIDGTYKKNSTHIERDFYVDNVPLQAAFVKPDADYKVFQGRTLHIQFQVNKDIKKARVHALASSYEVFPESKNSSIYECYIPIDCEESPNEYLFSVEVTDNVGNNLTLDNKFQIVAYPFKHERLHVSANKIKEEKELGLPAAELSKKLQELASNSPKEKLWRGQFCTPIDVQRVSCDFGTIRTTQEKGRYQHKALDVLNAPKSVVWATQDGVVVLKDRYESSGNTVVVDHGHGVLSLFYHLEDFADIEVGQKIAKGNPVGKLGKTGYATGYHLHWEMRMNNVPIDPMQWTKANF